MKAATTAFALMLAVAALSARGEGPAPVELSLARAEELAGRGSDEVRAREAAAEAALRAVDAARANFFPKLSGSVSGAYLANPPAGKSIAKGSIPIFIPPSTLVSFPPADLVLYPDAKDTYFKGSLTLTQPLFVWGKIRAAVDLASLEAQIAGIGGRGSALDARRSANRAYCSALLSRDGAAILEELRALSASILEDRQAAMDEGYATQADILSSRADLAALDAKLVQAREAEASAREALGLLTGLDGASLVLVSRLREALPPIEEASLKQRALATSTDLETARTRLAQARGKLELERGSSLLLPDLSLFASLDVSGQDIPFAGSSWTDTWSWNLSLGIAATADFFDGGASAARIKEASSSIEAARAGAAAAERAAALQARRAVDAARGAQASLREKEARAAWAAEALRNARAKAADQAISRPELNAAAIGEAAARLDLLYARYALEESIADLERIAGAGAGAGEGK